MNPPEYVRTPPPTAVAPASLRIRPGHVIAVVIVAAALMSLGRLFAEPPFINRITFVNPTPYDLAIEVSGTNGDSWTPLSFAARQTATVVEEIHDQGDTLTFRFAAQGQRGGELSLTREQLGKDGWRVQIPAEVGHRLARQGTPTPP